jgi:class 3 adenylate cyclase/tetratricopeptide (TPR) repeat protein
MAPVGGETSRRRVTALFCDLVGSTDITTSLDPEPLRALLAGYFDAVRGVIESHGGVVEKFIGDAVVGVFGVPRTHEDDALRAVRAALDVQAALAKLNEEIAHRGGVELVARIGVGTGNVVGEDAGSDHGFLAGEPLNLAARLQHAAGPSEVYLSDETYRLVSDQVETDEVGPLTLVGFATAVPAWRLSRVIERASVLTRDEVSPFVGREDELVGLREAAANGENCTLITVIGQAGIGKSRLVREFLQTVSADAQRVVGRCLSYGDGITYWPLAEIVRGVAADQAQLTQLLADEADRDVIVERLSRTVGWDGRVALTVEIQWAARRLFEALAASRSVLVVIVEDLHWAESTLLDLLEYTVGVARGRILIVGTARPELLDARPGWASVGKQIVLEPLAVEHASRVALSAGADEAAVARIVETAEGNPLFVEQLAALGYVGGDSTLPASIGGVLRARIDALPSGERGVLQCGSIEGRSFHVGGLIQLLDESARAAMTSDLASLVRKRLLRPDEPELAGEDAYRFTHVLLREEAYESLPHARRAEMHEQLADWLETRESELAAADEIVGHHLAEAHHYLRGVGGGEHVEELGRRAGELLVAAAFRADARDDTPSALSLFDRGLALLPPDARTRPRALFALGAIQETAISFDAALATLAESVAAGDRLGDRLSAILARLEMASIKTETRPSPEATARRDKLVDEAIRQAALAEDEWALAIAWYKASEVHAMPCHYREVLAATQQCLAHSQLAGNARVERIATGRLGAALEMGPTPAPQAIRQCERILAEARSDAIGYRMVGGLAVLVAMRGEHDRAYLLLDRMQEIQREHGIPEAIRNNCSWLYGRIAANEGDWPTVIKANRLSLEDDLRLGNRGGASTSLAWIAEGLAHLGELDEAERLANDAVEFGGDDDVGTHYLVASARSLIASKRGAHHDALRHAERALEIVNTTDDLLRQAQVHLNNADIHARRGDLTSANASAQHALALSHAKQSLVGEALAQAVINRLSDRTSA